MISIITSVHNQLGMNRLFVEYLKKYSALKYELIIIDNNSTDGSREFFEKEADILIKNQENYSYPVCQNQGIEMAKYEYMAFLNNDLLVSPEWDKKIIETAKSKNLEVLSFATNEKLENVHTQKSINRKWKRIKYPLIHLFGTKYWNLKLMFRLTYPNWENFCNKRYANFKGQTIEGFSGSCILLHKSSFNKIGKWDERIYSADFDLYYRSKERSLEKGDIAPLQTDLGVYFHHFQRLTIKSKYEPFVDQSNLISVGEKWGEARSKELNTYIGK